MTYNVFGGTLSLIQLVNLETDVGSLRLLLLLLLNLNVMTTL